MRLGEVVRKTMLIINIEEKFNPKYGFAQSGINLLLNGRMGVRRVL